MPASAAVIFSEIAWMGTEADVNDEWIEIYNFSNAPTDISGWTISDGDSLNIVLNGTMPPHGVFLLERTDDTSVPGVVAAVVYTGALSNSGETLTMRDAEGNVVGEPLVGGENWENIGGDNDAKYTAQFTTKGTWVTGPPTPGQPNIEDNVAPEIDDDDTEEVNKNTDQGVVPVVSKSKTSSPASSKKTTLVLPDWSLTLELTAPKIAYVHQPVTFTIEPSGLSDVLLNSVQHSWNLGDLTTGKGRTVTHQYEYPGTYVVVVDGEFKRHSASIRHEITVLPVSFSITKNTDGDIQINNDSPYEVDLSSYSVRGDETVVFPENTILLPKATLTIPKEKIGGTSYAWLFDQKAMIVASTLGAAPSPVFGAAVEEPTALRQPLVVTAPTPQISATTFTPTAAPPQRENNFQFANDTSDMEIVVSESPDTTEREMLVAESKERQVAMVPGSEIPVSNDKLPYLGLIGVLSIGLIALYASKLK